jgi:hypothetical protein
VLRLHAGHVSEKYTGADRRSCLVEFRRKGEPGRRPMTKLGQKTFVRTFKT